MGLIDRIEPYLTRERARILALTLTPVTLVMEWVHIWSSPETRWRFPYGHDFTAFWTATGFARQDQLSALYDPAIFGPAQMIHSVRDGYLGWFYPPTFLLLLLPFGLLAFGWAWTLFSALGYAAIGRAARGWLPYDGRTGMALLLGAPTMAVTLIQGQNGALVAAALTGGFVAQARGRTWLAAALFALLAAKPHLALLVPLALAATGQWRLIAKTALLSALFAGASALVLGMDAWRLYLDHLGDVGAAMDNRYVLAQMPTAFSAAKLLGLSQAQALITQGVCATAAAAYVWRLWRDGRTAADLRLAGLLVATLLIPPYGFRYDMVTTLVAALILWRRATTDGFLRGERLTLATLWLWPAVFPVVALVLPLQSGFALLLLALWAVARRRRADAMRIDRRPASP